MDPYALGAAELESKAAKEYIYDQFTLTVDPETAVIHYMNASILALRDFEDFGVPAVVGGTWNQPIDWLRRMRCILAARKDAERDKEAAKQAE